MTKKYNYDSLSKLDETRYSDKENYAKDVRLILKEFLSVNLEDSKCFDKSKLELIRHSIINFLFSGKFELNTISPTIAYNDEAMKQLSKIVILKDFQIVKIETEIKIKEEEQKQRSEEGREALKSKTDLIKKLKEKKRILEGKVANYPQNIQRIQDLRYIKNKNEIQKNELKKLEKNNKITPKDFFDKIHLSWNYVSELYCDYLDKLKKKLEKDNTFVERIIIYEAPPFVGFKKPEEAYLFTSVSSQYSKPIRDCFGCTDKNIPLSNFLSTKYLGFFDLSMACIPLNSELRYLWNTDKIFLIGEKQLPVVLFELSFEYFLSKIDFRIVKNPLFAIGTPVNTSIGLFEYYSLNPFSVYKDKKNNSIFFEFGNDRDEIVSADIALTNKPSTFKKLNKSGNVFPLFKANIVGPDNFPSAILMKNALNVDENYPPITADIQST